MELGQRFAIKDGVLKGEKVTITNSPEKDGPFFEEVHQTGTTVFVTYDKDGQRVGPAQLQPQWIYTSDLVEMNRVIVSVSPEVIEELVVSSIAGYPQIGIVTWQKQQRNVYVVMHDGEPTWQLAEGESDQAYQRAAQVHEPVKGESLFDDNKPTEGEQWGESEIGTDPLV